MDRRDVASNRGRTFARGNGRGRGWRGRGEGRGRASTQPPPPSTAAVAPGVTASEAPPIVGTCPDMCPATERAQRERLRDLAVFERVGGDHGRTSPSLAVKKIKFHILSHQRLATSCQDSDASSLCYLNTEQLLKCLLSLFDMYHIVHKNNSHSNREAEYYSFFVLLHLSGKIPKMADSLSLWYGQLPASVVRSKEMIFARTVLRCYHLGNFKRFFCMIAAEASDLQLCLVEPFLNEVRARALMYYNHSGYKLQHHPLTHLSEILMIEELELENLCSICGLEISESGDTKAFAPKQTSFSLPASISPSSGIYVSR